MSHFATQNLALKQLCKTENIDSEHLLGDDLKKTANKARTSKGMFKKSSNRAVKQPLKI